MLDIGTLAPDFTLPRDGGTDLSLADLRGKTVILYFYPKDNTPGCTTEALDFTALTPAFEAANAVVLGVSKDSVKKHDNFCKKHDLGIALLSDADGTLCEDYGVWQEKTNYGKTYMGIVRTTYIIDTNRKISHIFPKVKVKGHAEEVLAAVQEAARA